MISFSGAYDGKQDESHGRAKLGILQLVPQAEVQPLVDDCA